MVKRKYNNRDEKIRVCLGIRERIIRRKNGVEEDFE